MNTKLTNLILTVFVVLLTRLTGVAQPVPDIQWEPEPFHYVAGASQRYIDYENGSDSNPGTKAKPWKHHPWDEEARGNAAISSGIHTYLFKKGVIYRGQLIADESGEKKNQSA